MPKQIFQESWLDELETAFQNESTALTSVFDRIELKNHQYQPKYANTRTRKTLGSEAIVADTDALQGALPNDLAWLKNEQMKAGAKTETFFYLLQKHGWRVADPNETGKTDIPFADRWRIEKALAFASDKKEYLLFKGDLTGIQEFIYHNIEQKRAGGLKNLAKRLRGRSTLVALLTDFLANVYLRELGLPSFHLLFCGGGHFNLLLPDDCETEMDELTRELNEAMRHIFDDKLELHTAQVRCGESIREHAGADFQKLSEQLEAKKFKAHTAWLDALFFPKKASEGVENIFNGELLGKHFPKMNLVVETVSEVKIEDTAGSYQVLWFSKKQGEQVHSLFVAEDFAAANRLFVKNRDELRNASIFKINDTEIFPDDPDWATEFDFPISFGFRFFGKNIPCNPGDDDDILDFEELARPDKPNQNDRERNGKLAAMRLDVDDLGCIFAKGLGQHDSLERLATLSRELSYFFTAHFDLLAKTYDIYVIYSGGDDAFVVGRWDKLLRFAKKLQQTFQEFTGKNEDVHFSAGVFMGNPHFPVGRFYKEAEHWQDEAKKDNDKNQIGVFSHVLGWESFGEMLRHGDNLFKIMDTASGDDSKFSSGLAYRLLRIVKTSFYEKNEIRDGQLLKRGKMNPERFAENVAKLRYFFARQGFSKDKIKELQEGITRELVNVFLKAFSFNENSKVARDYLVALNYALFQKKYNDNNNG